MLELCLFDLNNTLVKSSDLKELREASCNSQRRQVFLSFGLASLRVRLSTM